jgi:hypothetical protein
MECKGQASVDSRFIMVMLCWQRNTLILDGLPADVDSQNLSGVPWGYN